MLVVTTLLLSAPSPPLACSGICGNMNKTCANLFDLLNCDMMEAIGCQCNGCCMKGHPPPEPPSLPPTWPPPPSPPCPPPEPPMPPPVVELGSEPRTLQLCGTFGYNARLLAQDSEGPLVYHLTCPVFVAKGFNLTIEAGTQIVAAVPDPHSDVGRSTLTRSMGEMDTDGDGAVSREECSRYLARLGEPSTVGDSLCSPYATVPATATSLLAAFDAGTQYADRLVAWAVLVIEAGGSVDAEGTPTAPVLMTTTGSSSWGGVVVMGRAPADGAYSVAPAPYGGETLDDSSGTMRYVKVTGAWRGFGFFGVGSSMTVDHCEAEFNEEIGFHLHGGGVNVRHLSSISSRQTAFKVSGGFGAHVLPTGEPTGLGQFLFALVPQSADGISVGEDSESAKGNVTHPRFLGITILGHTGSGTTSAQPSTLLSVAGGAGGSFGDAVLVGGTYSMRLCHGSSFTQSGTMHSAVGASVFLSNSSTAFLPALNTSSLLTGASCGGDFAVAQHYDTSNPRLVDLAGLTDDCEQGPCTIDPLPTRWSDFCEWPVTPRSDGSPSWTAAPTGGISWFEASRCSGAFSTEWPDANWLAGWSALFPLPLGTTPSYAIAVPTPGSNLTGGG